MDDEWGKLLVLSPPPFGRKIELHLLTRAPPICIEIWNEVSGPAA